MSAPRPDRPALPDDLPLLTLLRADLEATTHPNFRLYSPARFWSRAVLKTIFSANVRAVVAYRIARKLARQGFLPLALLMRSRTIRVSGAELNPLASIGPGLYLAHSVGVGIGARVVIGSRCKIHLGVVVGPQPMDQSEPHYTVIGDDVFIGTHAVIVGGVTIGDGAVIGANALVARDVAPYTIVSSAPARVVGTRDPDAPVAG
ncbi:serine O-acetyltransferase [Aeromicrobium sp. CTD01-1L150]|uniref:serine O-acetyltransferase n=1 Tax=Aeromicrobium sp. CTD01-1L150 TaxID=3341830 RepID=UPI0035C151F4